MHFNSQPHKEADNYSEWCSINSYISTHSLTRRLTTFGIFPVFPALAFQLTASQGGWRMNQRVDLFKWAFQLTASQGGWLSSFSKSFKHQHFNSQPHKEADVGGVTAFGALTISTHSLTRRLTRLRSNRWGRSSISTHSLTRRLTPSTNDK